MHASSQRRLQSSDKTEDGEDTGTSGSESRSSTLERSGSGSRLRRCTSARRSRGGDRGGAVGGGVGSDGCNRALVNRLNRRGRSGWGLVLGRGSSRDCGSGGGGRAVVADSDDRRGCGLDDSAS